MRYLLATLLVLIAACGPPAARPPIRPPVQHPARRSTPSASAAPRPHAPRASIVYSGTCQSDADCPVHRRCLLLRSIGADGVVNAYGNCVPKDSGAYPGGYPSGTVPPR